MCPLIRWTHIQNIFYMYQRNNFKIKSNFEQFSCGEELKDRKIRWVDIQRLAHEDNDVFTKADFIFYGNRQLLKKWWLLIIPIINIFISIQCLIYILTAPIRLSINNKLLRELYSNANDIEDIDKLYRIIRNEQGYLGLCVWGKSFEYKRKLILPPIYNRIIRCNDDSFVITDKNGKMGLYNSTNNKWMLPCANDKITIYANDLLIVVNNGTSSQYSFSGYRIAK